MKVKKINNIYTRTISLILSIILGLVYVGLNGNTVEVQSYFIGFLALLYAIFNSLEKHEEDNKIKPHKVVFIEATSNAVDFNNKINSKLDNLTKNNCKIIDVKIVVLNDNRKEAYIFFVKNK